MALARVRTLSLLLATLAGCASDPALDDGAADVASTEQAAVAKPPQPWRGAITTVVLVSEFAVDTYDPWMMASIQTQMATLDTFIRGNSYGRAWLEYRILGPYLLSPADCQNGPDDSYNMQKILTETALAADSAVDYTGVESLFVITKGSELCNSHDQGQRPGGPAQAAVPTAEPLRAGVVWSLFNPTTFNDTLVHEFGHTMSGGHIEVSRCTRSDGTRATLVHSAAEGSCALESYYLHRVSSEPMNNRHAHFNPANKALFGWLDPGESVSTRDGQALLTPVAVAGGVKLLQIPLQNSTWYSYVLEYRQPVGDDAGTESWQTPLNGVFMHATTNPSNGMWGIRAIDLPPFETSPIVLSALPLAVQQPDGSYTPSFIDAAQGIAIYVYSMTPTGASVAVKPFVNWARSSSGGVVYASSTSTQSIFAKTYVNDGDRKGHSWGGWWQSSTAANAFTCYNNPQAWVYVAFSATRSISEIDVFGLQDNYWDELTPTLGMLTTRYGLVHFHAQYWNGVAWTDVPGGYVINNNQAWRKLTFAPISTRYVRVLMECFNDYWARLVEVEAWGAP